MRYQAKFTIVTTRCLISLASFAFVLGLTACNPQFVEPSKHNHPPTVKNLILLIGDGMGPQQLGLLQEYAQRAKHSVYKDQSGETAFDKFASAGFVGSSRHGPVDALVVDSACSASQLASGVASGSEMIGLDHWGDPVETILEKAKKMGKATGLVSDTRITHATPAAFASHQRHRSLESDIALEMLTSNHVDIMLSGGLKYWLPAAINSDAELRRAVRRQVNDRDIQLFSARDDEQNLLQLAERQGYSLAFNRRQLQQTQTTKILGLFASSAMLDAISYEYAKQASEPSLAELVKKALDILVANPKGFFLMIEGGQIDWAGHNNDAGTLLHEMLKFEQAVAAVYQWVKDRNDTLVVITGDHETGGFGFSYSRYQVPIGKPLPGKMFKDHQYRPNFNFGNLNILDRLYQQKKSFAKIWEQAAKGADLPTSVALMAAVNANSEFKINREQARQIMQVEVNEYHQASHKYLNKAMFPKIHDFKEFYVSGDGSYLDLIGRKLAKQQNVVWATGTHTHTPVPVIAWGPVQFSRQFSSLSHHIDLGKWMINALIGEEGPTRRRYSAMPGF